MHQNTPFHEFEEFETVPARGRGRWIVWSILIALALSASAAVGYGLGRGTWTIPRSLTEHVPASLASWLPRSGAAPACDGTPDRHTGEGVERSDGRATHC